MNIYKSAVAIFLLLALELRAQTNKTKIIGVENSLFVSDDPMKKHNIIARMKYHNVPSVSIAVIHAGKIEWTKAYGYADINKKKKATVNTIYQAASISKTVNAFYIMKLWQENKISLDEDIRLYLKSWKFKENRFSEGKKITIRNLLSHTGGFGVSGFMGYPCADSLPTINQMLNGEKPANNEPVQTVLPVNTQYTYSGGGTLITRKIIEDNIATNYDSLISINVLQPLKMNRSTFQQDIKSQEANFATAYDGGVNEVNGKYNIYPELAPDGLWSTPNDIAKLVISIQQSLAKKKSAILTYKTASEMVTPVLNTQDIALGAFLIEKGDEKYFVHLGGNRGFQSIFYGSFTTGNGLVIMANSDNVHPTLMKELVNSIATVYKWKDFFNPNSK